MSAQSTTEAPPVRSGDLFSEVRPGGILGRCLDSISNHKKHRWNSYLRACKRIPKSSPVYGSTSFKVLNERRHELIHLMHDDEMRLRKEVKESDEYKAINGAVGKWLCGPTIAESFLLARILRRIKRLYPENTERSGGTSDAANS